MMSSPLPLVFPDMQYSDISTVWEYFCKLSVKKINELGDKKYSVGNIVKNKVISLYDNSN